MSKKRETRKAIRQIDRGVLTAVDALVQALSELDVEERSRKRVIKREYPASDEEGKRTVTEEESEIRYEKGKVDVSSLRTLVGVLGELRSMLKGDGDENAGGIIILPSKLICEDDGEADE